MGKVYGWILLWISVFVRTTVLAQCPNTVSIRISQVNQPDQLAYNSFCQGEQVQLNVIGAQSGLTYQWKRNGENLATGTSPTYLAGVAGYYTVTVQGASGCTVTSLPVTIEVNDCQPTGRARIRGVYLEDFNGDASVPGFQNPFLRLGYLTYKSELAKFPPTVQVRVYQKSNNRLITTLTLQRVSKLERNLLSLDAACGIESTQLYDVLYFMITPSGDPAPFNFDPAIYNDPGGYYLVSDGICCREPTDNISGTTSDVVGYMELVARQQYNLSAKASMIGGVYNLVSKVETCLGQPVKIDYFDAKDPNNIIRVDNALIQAANVTRIQYSLETSLTSGDLSVPPFYRRTTFAPGFSAINFAGTGIQIDPTTGTITGTPTRPGTYAYVVKAETFNGNTRLSEIRRELQLIVKECPTSPQPRVTAAKNPLCPGDKTQLNAVGGITGATYQWQRNGVNIAGATSSTISVEQDGAYTVSVTKATACPPFALSEPLRLSVVAPSVTLTTGATSGTDCQNALVQLNAAATANDAATTFRWFLNGTQLTGVAGPVYSTSMAGQYTVQVTQPDGCTAASSPVSVSLPGAPVAPTIVASTTAVCPGKPANLSIDPQPGSTYQWLQGGQIIVGATTNTLSVTQAGSYAVRVQTTSGCPATSRPAALGSFNPPIVAIRGEAQICQGSSTSLSLANQNVSTNGWQFFWQRNGATVGTLPIYQATAEGTYKLRVTDANGCTAVSPDWLINEVRAITVQIVPLPPVCLSPSSPITLSATPSGGVFSGSGVVGNQFSPAVAGAGSHPITYTLTGSSSCLSGSATQTIVVRPAPVISLPTRLTTLVGTPVLLPGPAGTGYVYSWNPPTSLDDPTLRTPSATPTQSTTYRLQLRDNNGCLAEGTVLVDVVRADVRLFVPNAFTPNNDGNNDAWRIWGADAFPQIDVTVFNRWGEVIFHSIGYNDSFNGYYRGVRVQSGVYTYVIRYDERKDPLRGTVMVIY